MRLDGNTLDVAPRRVCECCEREQGCDDLNWAISREGDDYCGECWRSLMDAAQQLIDELPKRIALCPQCAPEFYYPLNDGESLICPTSGCSMDMVVYLKQESR